MRHLVLLWALAVVSPAQDLVTAAQEARQTAEADVVQVRARIAEERRALVRRVQAAVAAAQAARADGEAAQASLAAALTAQEQRRAEAQRDVLAARQAADRALAAARGTSSAPDPLARAEAASAALEARLSALPALLAEHRAVETVLDRAGVPQSVPVLRLGQARALALGPDDITRGLLVEVPGTAALRVVGPHLPPGPGLPVDPTGTVARQDPPAHGLVAWIKAGRLFIWPILITFGIAVGILVARILALRSLTVDGGRLRTVGTLLQADRITDAEALVAPGATPLDRVLKAGIAARGRSLNAREALVEEALVAEAARLRRGASLVLVLAGICPLLGLLGTVTGMIDLFSVIAATGSGAAKSVSGGISEALVTTQAGMITAIPLLIGHALLSRAVEKREHLLEQAACRVLGLDDAP